MAKELKHFRLFQRKEHIEIFCLFGTTNPEVTNEANSIFHTIFFGSRHNVKIHLGKISYMDQHLVTSILNLGRDLREKNRYLILTELPISTQRYFQKFSFDNIIYCPNLKPV
ncbi:MAG: hypothetical protein K8R21_00050 [Leptospira sp.]|nr:hypothetical protein [Leptospira sp.]